MRIIGGCFKNRKIKIPKNTQVRPTTGQVREAFFNICQQSIEGVHFLDLFAGSGAMGIEALSRGALKVTFIEKNKECVRCLQQNIKDLSIESQGRILWGDVLQLLGGLAKQGEQFQIAYADPPYHLKDEDQVYWELLSLFDQIPLLSEGGDLFVETGAQVTLKQFHQRLKKLRLLEIRSYGICSLHHYTQIMSI